MLTYPRGKPRSTIRLPSAQPPTFVNFQYCIARNQEGNPEWRDDGCPAVSVYDGNDIKEVQIGWVSKADCVVQRTADRKVLTPGNVVITTLIESNADFDMTISGTSYLLPNKHARGNVSGVEAIVRLSSRHNGPARVRTPDVQTPRDRSASPRKK